MKKKIKIIDKTQCGFMIHRHITTNIRLMLDLLIMVIFAVTVDYCYSWISGRFLTPSSTIVYFKPWKKLVSVLTLVNLSRPCITMLIIQWNLYLSQIWPKAGGQTKLPRLPLPVPDLLSLYIYLKGISITERSSLVS